MTIDELRKKKIVLLGLGVNNRKLAEYLSLKQIAYDVIKNWKKPDELLGKLDRFEIIFRSPGLPYLSGPIQEAKSKGVAIYSQTKLFFDLCPAPIIGVTGTKGKSTTASLIFEILRKGSMKVWLSGNIGADPFEFVDQIKPDDWAVLELSSFQLQDLHKSPHVAVVTNFYKDHLDHHLTMEEYAEAKVQILRDQTKSDFAVLNQSLPELFKNAGDGKRIFFTSDDASPYPSQLLGRHNLENIAAAVAVGELLGTKEELLKSAIAQFSSLSHRLQVIGKIDEVVFIDDSISTNVGSTLAAIDAFNSPLILIVGGFDKGLDYLELGSKIKNSTVKCLVVVGQTTQKILEAIKGFEGKVMTGAQTMQEIIAQARSLAVPGDTILFSPAAASFDMFKDAKDRGEQFTSGVMKL